MKFFIVVFIAFVAFFDRTVWKANHGFSLHVIEAPLAEGQDLDLVFPRDLFSEPFHYLGRGAQVFVFESRDHVLKFYRFPSHLRRFPWAHHPFGYLFSSARKKIKEHNLKRLALSFHSFYLAAKFLPKETGALYVHLHPTSHLAQKVHLIDKLGSHYELPLDGVVFVVQKKGVSFLPAFQEQLSAGHLDACKAMLQSLIEVISSRCAHGITDLDNMDNDNYGWQDGRALHLDIGRFQEKEGLNRQEEILRVAGPLTSYLERVSPELHADFLHRVAANDHL